MAYSLSETCQAFADACNAIFATAFSKNISNSIDLQRLTYYTIREQFKLSANLTVRAVRRVASAITASKKRGKVSIAFKPTSIDYDARIFDYREKDETVSLTVMGGRIHVPLILGDFQRRALTGKKPTFATVIRKGQQWFAHIVIEDTDATPVNGPAIGIDLGIRNTATTSNGTLHDGTARRKFKEDRARVRASLQSKGTPGAKRVLRRLSGYENRRIRHENHVLSKQIVDEAVKAHCGIIRMERLTHIRQRCRIRNRHMNRMMSGWSFGQLQTFIEYKAKRVGLVVEYVDPAYTSQTCPKCGLRGTRKQDIFQCSTCGTMHADVVGALNIAGGGVVNLRESRQECFGQPEHFCT
jgi:putative transposase